VLFRWLARHREGGEFALQDRSSAPSRCPHRTGAETIATIERLRRQRMTGPAIAEQLNMPRATVGAVLRRLGLGRLSALDTKPPIVRYERDKPGELIHIDIKKLGRIDGVGLGIGLDRWPSRFPGTLCGSGPCRATQRLPRLRRRPGSPREPSFRSRLCVR
jgi:hypothetical protein